MGEYVKDYAYSQDCVPTEMFEAPAQFAGIRRASGAHVFKKKSFRGDDPLKDFPDGLRDVVG